MTEQPTTPPEPIQQSAFPTGRGVCWSAHPNIDGVVPPTQPYQPPARTRPAGWAKTGSVGASATLGADEEPVTVPARPYGGWDRPLVSEEVYVPCRFDDETCVGQVTADRLCDVHRLGPSAPSVGAAGSSLGAAMHTCADHCQCDVARCSSCADCGHVCENHPDRPWAGISDDINACDCGGAGMPCPVCCDPIPEDGSTSIGAAFIPRKFAAGGLVRPPSDPADDVVPFPVTRCLYEQPRAEAPVVDVAKPGCGIVSIAEARSWGIEPPPAVELLAMADDLNTHGGYDERFVAALLLAAMPPHLIGDRVPDPMHHEQPIRAVPDPLERPWWRRALDRARRWTR